MTRAITLTLTETMVSFNGYRDALLALRRHGLKPMPARGRWMLDRSRHHVDRVADIAAVLEHAGFTVELEGVLPQRKRGDQGQHHGGVDHQASNSNEVPLW
jgi:hypothetical protein